LPRCLLARNFPGKPETDDFLDEIDFRTRAFYQEPMTISLGVKKVEKLLQRDRDISKRVKIMEMNLREKSKKKYFITIA